jgi:hypothetical protein
MPSDSKLNTTSLGASITRMVAGANFRSSDSNLSRWGGVLDDQLLEPDGNLVLLISTEGSEANAPKS